MLSTFQAATAYIASLDQLDTPKHSYAYAAELGMARAAHLLAQLDGAPTSTTQCVLVAGSKGKGSTVAMLSTILATAGYRVGSFTGPHLHSPRERFALLTEKKIQLMPERVFVAFANRIQHIVQTWDRDDIGEPTRFEAFTAMAYRWFEEKRADVCVMEIGIGGRLDAVNLAEPILSVITNISLEHTQMLGDTLAQIAREKAGVLRAGRVGIIARQTDEATQAFNQVAKEKGAHLKFADDCVSVQLQRLQLHEPTGQTVTATSTGATENYFLPLLGQHQLQNLAAVLTAVQTLNEQGWRITPQHIRVGLQRVVWHGRFEILHRTPLIIADGAHTPYSMAQLCEALRTYFPQRRIHFVLSILRDKDARNMLHAVAALATSITFTQTPVARSLLGAQLMEMAQALGVAAPHRAEPALPGALQSVYASAHPNDVICIAGSLHLVAEAREILREHHMTSS